MIESADFQIGRVVSRAALLLMRHGLLLPPLCALLMAPMMWSYLTSLLHPRPDVPLDAQPLGYRIGFALFVPTFLIVAAALQYLAPAALALGALADLNDKDRTFGERLAAGIKALFPVCAIALVSVTGFTVGLALLVVPGLVVMAAWSVAIPACMSENTGVLASLRRSWSLTRGCRVRIFTLLLMDIAVCFALLLACFVFVVVPLFGLDAKPGPFVDGIILCVVLVLSAAVTAATTASIYVELRLVKEGVAPQQLAAAFD